MKIAGGECIFSFFCHLLSLYSGIFYTSMEPWSLIEIDNNQPSSVYLLASFLLHILLLLLLILDRLLLPLPINFGTRPSMIY